MSTWNEKTAELIAESEGLVLSPDHWAVINFLRDFYLQYQTIPTVRILVKELAKQLGAEKGNSIYLHSLFPQGLIKQAAKIAGLPKSARCM